MDPKQSVPRATYIAVITLGVFYTFVAYAGIVGFGDDSPKQAATLLRPVLLQARRPAHVRRRIAPPWTSWSSPASSPAPSPSTTTPRATSTRSAATASCRGVLGRTHPTHKSPHIAAGVQATIAIATVAIFAIGGADPLLHLGTWLPIFCTLAVLARPAARVARRSSGTSTGSAATVRPTSGRRSWPRQSGPSPKAS